MCHVNPIIPRTQLSACTLWYPKVTNHLWFDERRKTLNPCKNYLPLVGQVFFATLTNSEGYHLWPLPAPIFWANLLSISQNCKWHRVLNLLQGSQLTWSSYRGSPLQYQFTKSRGMADWKSATPYVFHHPESEATCWPPKALGIPLSIPLWKLFATTAKEITWSDFD